jgi:hypothetical protein
MSFNEAVPAFKERAEWGRQWQDDGGAKIT